MFDTDSFISNDKGFIIPTENASSVAILNSKAIWFVIQGICSPLRGGIWRYELRGQNIETLPHPHRHQCTTIRTYPSRHRLRLSG
ncbi:MAG: hypothetical protein V9E91_14005 [Burkholderiaceae bacterium]